MRVGYASEHLGRGPPNTLGTFAPQKTPMVEEELKQSEVVGAQVKAEKEIAPQSTVEVLDQGTGSNRPGPQLVDRFTNLEEPAWQLLTENGLLLVSAGSRTDHGKATGAPREAIPQSTETHWLADPGCRRVPSRRREPPPVRS